MSLDLPLTQAAKIDTLQELRVDGVLEGDTLRHLRGHTSLRVLQLETLQQETGFQALGGLTRLESLTLGWSAPPPPAGSSHSAP